MQSPLRDLMTTSGRIPRSTFWLFHLVVFGLLALLGLLADAKGAPEWAKGVVGLLMIPVLVMRIIVEIKRWHDRDKSGWWVLIGLVPCIGGLWVLIECGFLPGTPGPNRFGPDPLQMG